MNYGRIYEAFIASRRQREAFLIASGDCFQKHHVVPKKLGGGNDPENIIALRPEDHLFAHLLLAKIHGGIMWRPVFFMVGRGKRFNAARRSSYGWAARAASRLSFGRHAYQFDKTIYEFENKDGRQFQGYRQDFILAFDLAPSAICTVIQGRAAHYKGWYVRGQRPAFFGRSEAMKGARHHQYKDEVLALVHEDGRRFVGTRLEAHRAIGIRRPSLSKLVAKTQRKAEGWRLEA